MGVVARPLRKVRQVNYVGATYRTVSDTFVDPAGDALTATGASVIQLSQKGGMGVIPTFLELWPYGLGNKSDTMSMRVISWQKLLDPLLQTPTFTSEWCPAEVGEFLCTLSNDTGITNGAVNASERYCDTISVVAEESFTAATTRQGTVYVLSPANDKRGHIRIDLEGVEKVEILFQQGGTGTPSMNALYRLYDRY